MGDVMRFLSWKYRRRVSMPNGKSKVDEVGVLLFPSPPFKDISFSQATKPRSSFVPGNGWKKNVQISQPLSKRILFSEIRIAQTGDQVVK